MSADARPITAPAFAAALKDLTLSSLHLKVLELRNSIAHLEYSNEQLRPYAEGRAVAVPTTTTTSSSFSTEPQTQTQTESPSATSATQQAPAATAGVPDQDCVDAIRENEQVLERMRERIRLVRAEVESRGIGWAEFESEEERKARAAAAAAAAEEEDEEEGRAMVNGDHSAAGATTNGVAAAGAGEQRHPAWSDGTFQTGVIRNGVLHMDGRGSSGSGSGGARRAGGSLTDEELRRRMEEQLRGLGDGEEDGGDGGLYL